MTARRTSHSRTAHNGHTALRRKADEVVESVQQLGAEAKRTATKQTVAARDAAVEFVDARRRSVEEVAGRNLKDRPVAALCMAAAVGFVAGWIWRR